MDFLDYLKENPNIMFEYEDILKMLKDKTYKPPLTKYNTL